MAEYNWQLSFYERECSPHLRLIQLKRIDWWYSKILEFIFCFIYLYLNISIWTSLTFALILGGKRVVHNNHLETSSPKVNFRTSLAVIQETIFSLMSSLLAYIWWSNHFYIKYIICCVPYTFYSIICVFVTIMPTEYGV